MKIRFLLSCVMLFLLLTCTACRSEDDFLSGHPITPDELASISEAVFNTEPPAPQDTATPIDTLPDADSYPADIVHWSAGGTVYHNDPTCYHLARADTVYHGTQDNAKLAGKEKLCSACEKRQAETETETKTDSR